MILIDTNVLVYAIDQLSPHHEPSKRVVDAVIESRINDVLVPQVLVEFIGVTTGPSVASPLLAEVAIAQATIFRSQIRTLDPSLAALRELEEIVRTAGKAGRRIFDYFLAAQARSLGVDTICTYNRTDFHDIAGIVPISPVEIALPD